MSDHDEHGCRSRDWYAVHDHMPGPNKEWVTKVTGVVTTPTDGWTVELRLHEPPGINPEDLLLDLVCIPRSDGAADVLTDHDVAFSQPGEYEYKTASVIGHTSVLVEHPH